MAIRFGLAAAFIATALCAACSGSDDAASAPDNGATGGVVREEAPVPDATPAAAQTAIQTQPGPEGSQVALNKVAVTGDILTVQLSYVRPGATSAEYDHPDLDQVSVIDDATSQRIGVLKDDAGNWMASPKGSGDQMDLRIESTPLVVWFKFPAPPATSKTVSINVPDVAPFDGVPVTR